MMVSDFICSATRTWNVPKLEEHMLPMDVEAVRQIPISYMVQSDSWAWNHEKTGVFSVRSAYRMIMDTKHRRENFLEGRTEASNIELEEKNWKRIWKVKVPSKIRIFAWRLARSSLPTGELREHRHMASSAVCPVCNAAIDTWRHSLLDCHMARAVWALKEDDISLPLIADETHNPKLWLFSLSNMLSQEKFIEVLVTLWAIWWARRKLIHEDEHQSPLSTHAFIGRYLDDLTYIRKSNENPPRSRPAGRSSWSPPPAGKVKINVDGAVAKTERRGAVQCSV
jgi:hypothetical protein